MNLWLSSVIFMAILTFLSGFSDVCDKEISFNTAKSMPGYGYLIFDFRESREIKNITACIIPSIIPMRINLFLLQLMMWILKKDFLNHISHTTKVIK